MPTGPVRLCPYALGIVCEEAGMAAARDQAARAIRPDAETAEGEAARDTSGQAPGSGEQLRPSVAEETRRIPAEAPPPAGPGGPPAAAPAADAAKSGKRKFVVVGILGLLALAAASYIVYYVFIGRFYVSTDDAYVRANNTMLGARVAGHITAVVPGDNNTVKKGDVIFRIDDGDYRIAVDSA